MGDPSRTAYRYLQHYIQHPATLALSQERNTAFLGRQVAAGIGQARRALPHRRRLRAHRRRLRQHQHAHRLRRRRGMDHGRAAWRIRHRTAPRLTSHLRSKISKPPTRRDAAQAGSRRGAEEAKNARNGFHRGIVRGMIGMALAGLTGGTLSLKRPHSIRRRSRFARFQPRKLGVALKEAEQLAQAARARMDAHSTMPCSQRAAGPRFHSTAACSSPSRMRC